MACIATMCSLGAITTYLKAIAIAIRGKLVAVNTISKVMDIATSLKVIAMCKLATFAITRCKVMAMATKCPLVFIVSSRKLITIYIFFLYLDVGRGYLIIC